MSSFMGQRQPKKHAEKAPRVPWPVPNQENSTLDLLRMFRPCVRCGSYARFGSAQDGGYVMCDDPELLQGVRAAYSFGIQGSDDWGLSVSRRLGGIQVAEFDCTDDRRPACDDTFEKGKCPLRFHKECLGMPWYGRKKGYLYRTLGQHLARNPPPKDHNGTHKRQVGGDLLLKVDLAGQEYATFARARNGDLQRMRQIVVEFHSLSKVWLHGFSVVAVRRILDAGFVVAHIHGNNFGPMDIFAGGRFQIPDAVEVTFVNKRALTERHRLGCSTTQDLLPQDAPNHGFFELPLAKLPDDGDFVNGFTSKTDSFLESKASAATLPKGTRVKARKRKKEDGAYGKKWHSGVIRKMNADGNFEIEYTDGNVSTANVENIRLEEASTAPKLLFAHQCRWFCRTEFAGPAAWPLVAVSGITLLMVVGLLRTACSPANLKMN